MEAGPSSGAGNAHWQKLKAVPVAAPLAIWPPVARTKRKSNGKFSVGSALSGACDNLVASAGDSRRQKTLAIMEKTHSSERLMKILQASPAQLAVIDRVLDGITEPPRPERKGPFLLKMGDAAALLGVSRPTLWRMLNAGRLARVEILPSTYRVRREEIEEIVFGKAKQSKDIIDHLD